MVENKKKMLRPDGSGCLMRPFVSSNFLNANRLNVLEEFSFIEIPLGIDRAASNVPMSPQVKGRTIGNFDVTSKDVLTLLHV